MPSLFPGADVPQERPKPAGRVVGLRCAEPGCGGELVLRWSGRLESWFYGCTRFPECEGVLPANEDGSPRGRPRTRELQGWRNRAHQAFDRIWKDGHVSRGVAYAWLQAASGWSAQQAHMFEMSVQQCQRVIRLVAEKGPGTEFWRSWRRRRPRRRRRRFRKG